MVKQRKKNTLCTVDAALPPLSRRKDFTQSMSSDATPFLTLMSTFSSKQPSAPHSARTRSVLASSKESPAPHSARAESSTGSTATPGYHGTVAPHPSGSKFSNNLFSIAQPLHSWDAFGEDRFPAFEASASECDGTSRQTRNRVPIDVLTRAMKKPSSRLDAVVLRGWINTAVEHVLLLKAGGVPKKQVTAMVERTVPMLARCLHEIIRQSECHCAEMGIVLEKLWRTYVELFDRALKDLNGLLKQQETYVSEVEVELGRVRKEMSDMATRHPAHMEHLGQSLKTKFAQRHQEHYDRLKYRDAETHGAELLLAERKNDIKLVFPNFERYCDALDINEAPDMSERATRGNQDIVGALALDIERLVQGTKSREEISIYIGPLLAHSVTDISLLQQQWHDNAATIAELEKTNC